MSAELEAIQKRMADRKEATAKAREAQYLVDMAALDALEEKYGDSCVKALHVKGYVKGLPTFAVVKSPGGTSFHKRFCDQVRNAKGNKQAEGAAQDMLARSSIVYPEGAMLDSMFDAYPNMLNDASKVAVEFVALEAEEEKKG